MTAPRHGIEFFDPLAARLRYAFVMFAAVLLLALSSLQTSAQAPGSSPAQTANPESLYDSAVQAQMRGDDATAVRDYRRLIKLRPQMVEAHVNLGAALAHLGQFDAAIVEYRAALPLMQDKTGALFNIALAYYKKGDWKNAREQFTPLFQSRPGDVRVAILLADTELKLKDSVAAVAVLEPLEEANAQNADYDFIYASALIQAGRRRDGIVRAEKSAEISHAVDAYLLAGTTLLQVNEFERAYKTLDTALALQPDLPAAIYSLAGVAKDKGGLPELAEIDFREALKRNPDDFDANLYLGAILYKRRQTEEARPLLEHALGLDPKSSMARYEVAMLRSTDKDYQAAANELEKLATDDPQWLEPHIELASLYYKLHRPEDGARERKIVEQITAEQQKKGPQ